MKITALRSFMSCDRDRPRVLVAVDTDEGITGWGECYNHGPDRALPPLLEYLYLQIEGQDPTRVEALILKLLQQSRFPPGALGLAAINLAMRRNKDGEAPAGGTVALTGATAALLGVTGWAGAELSYRHMVGVAGHGDQHDHMEKQVVQ